MRCWPLRAARSSRHKPSAMLQRRKRLQIPAPSCGWSSAQEWACCGWAPMSASPGATATTASWLVGALLLALLGGLCFFQAQQHAVHTHISRGASACRDPHPRELAGSAGQPTQRRRAAWVRSPIGTGAGGMSETTKERFLKLGVDCVEVHEVQVRWWLSLIVTASASASCVLSPAAWLPPAQGHENANYLTRMYGLTAQDLHALNPGLPEGEHRLVLGPALLLQLLSDRPPLAPLLRVHPPARRHGAQRRAGRLHPRELGRWCGPA